MHPLLQNLSVFTWMDIIQSDEMCASLLGELGLIPEKTDIAPTCPKCSGSMKVRKHKGYALRWQWICNKHKSKENPCFGVKNPLDGTFFENNKMPLMDVLGLMFGYFLKITVKEMEDHINCWRKSRKQKQISHGSVISLYSRFKEIIFIALRKKGEFSESLEKADVRKVFQKYSKTIEVEPFFRNLVFQFLMDVKCEYPCLGNKRVHQYIDMSASVSSSSANVDVDISVQNENGSNLYASSNVSLSSISVAAHRNENTNVGGAEKTNNAPVTTSAPTTTTSTVSKNTRLPNCASASTAEGISSDTSANMDVQNTQTSNYNAVAIANNCTNNSTLFLENSQILNNSTVASISVVTPNNRYFTTYTTTTTLKNAPILSSNTVTIENVHTLIDDTDAIGIVQTSNNNLDTVSFPLSFSTDSLDKNLEESTSPSTVFFIDESMDIETEVNIKTE